MGNVLSETKRQQVIALGRMGWSLRRIEQETGVRRETAGGYLKASGIAVGRPGGWRRKTRAKPATVTTDSDTEIPSLNSQTEGEISKPAMEVTTDLVPSAVAVEERRQTSASACELYRETIQLGLSQGRNAIGIWQDLVDGYLSGSSRHCAPVPSTQSTPLRTVRVSCQGRPRLSARRDGRSTGSIISHCSSVSSQRLCMRQNGATPEHNQNATSDH
jgi:hypothetical protein